ncbi:MAG: aminoglycoside phosphotransferase family protein [Leptolyngbya sp. Prado105]|jgi:hypothetical protein|nr:aminoglycoside phosphotransferase family protein [Leptolyngbya sp. Prado105]
MPFLLSSQNVLNYLIEHQIYDLNLASLQDIQPKSGKNFNLFVKFQNQVAFLVKQERFDIRERTNNEFKQEWYLQQFLRSFPELAIQQWIVEPIHVDLDRSITVFEYLSDYCDLYDFYERKSFPVEIAAELGTVLARLHRSTLNQAKYQAFLTQLDPEIDHVPRILYGLERIGVSVFQNVRRESLEFYRMYQRFESLATAIAQLKQTWNPCCLVHQDLRLENVLVQPESGEIRIIDWEKFGWGDPAFDLGTVIAHYLRIWLRSLVIHKGLDLTSMLRLAVVPISQLQPSLVAMQQAYLAEFPDVGDGFLARSLQFAGAILIEMIQIKLEHFEAFDNGDIVKLQVAKTLLCQPEQAISTIFGNEYGNNSRNATGYC